MRVSLVTLPTVTADPLDGVMTYPVMAEPPLLAGAVQVGAAEAFPAVAVPMVGAPGTVAGVTELEAEEFVPVPTPLMAATVKVKAVPLVRPVTVSLVTLPTVTKDTT
jgi:hypothetical protein